MKRLVILTAIICVGGAAIYLAERRRAEADVSPRALLHFLGDTQRELTRLPAGATRLSDEDEVRIGQELLQRYEPRVRRLDAPPDTETAEIQRYVSRVGSRVALKAHRKLPYTFHYIPDSHFVNAFALPGGPVFIGGGLIALMDSEDELASVLAHEVEHIDHYHCAERVQVEARTRRLGLAGALLQIPITLFEAGYTKEQELEADSEGARIAVMAGYSPLGSIRMFEAFDRAYREAVERKARSPQQELANVALQTIEGYFRSHPPSSERAARIRDLMQAEGWKPSPERDLEIGWAFWSMRADELLSAHRYDAAQVQAERVLKLKPGYMKALYTLAQAQEFQGNFEASAAALRQMLDHEPSSRRLAFEYGDALRGIPDHARAAREFENWVNSPDAPRDPSFAVPVAGLWLLAGNSTKSDAFLAQVRNHGLDTNLYDYLGRLAGWYYLAARYDDAADLLQRSTQLLPGDTSLIAQLGWVRIEQARYADALAIFQRLASRDHATAMGAAVAYWWTRQRSAAIPEFAPLYDQYPEWRNPRWVRATYSPGVWRAVSQMAAELERQRKANLRASGHPQAD